MKPSPRTPVHSSAAGSLRDLGEQTAIEFLTRGLSQCIPSFAARLERISHRVRAIILRHEAIDLGLTNPLG